MKTALENVKALEVEVRQWQSRVDSAQSERASLERANAALREEAKNLRATLEQDAAAKLAEVRKATLTLNQQKDELEAQKAEFLKALTAFKLEKTACEQEKQTALDMKKNSQAITDKVGAFIRLVKSAAEGL